MSQKNGAGARSLNTSKQTGFNTPPSQRFARNLRMSTRYNAQDEEQVNCWYGRYQAHYVGPDPVFCSSSCCEKFAKAAYKAGVSHAVEGQLSERGHNPP